MAYNKSRTKRKKGGGNFIPAKGSAKPVQKKKKEREEETPKPKPKAKVHRGKGNKKPKPKKNLPKTAPIDAIGMRLNKYVAQSGVCSRRQAADYVKQGMIKVNEKIESNPAYQIQEGDIVKFKDEVVRPEENAVYILLNKPKDVITTVKDDRGRKTVMDIVRNTVKERIFPVGRLDRATTGLLLLTNDGDLAKKLSHPSHGIKKFYHVVLDKPVTKAQLQLIRKGLELEDGVAIVDGVTHIRDADKNEVGIELHIGKNRIVRRIFEHLGFEVKRLDRTYYGGLTKKDIARGFFRHLTDKEVIMLKHFT